MSASTFILIGRSGSGKGTQAKLLKKYLAETSGQPVFHIESGDFFRNFIAKEGYSNGLSSEIYKRGDFQPTFLSVWMWSTMLIDTLKGDEHIIFDGTPRNPEELPILDSAFRFYGRTQPTVILIDIDEETARKRMHGRGRPDDLVEENIEQRLAQYISHVEPIVEGYKNMPGYRFISVDGTPDPETIHADIVRQL